MVPESAVMLLFPFSRDLLDFFGRQGEGENTQHVAQTLLLGAGGDGQHALVDAPAQQDLAGVDGVLLGQALDQAVHGSTLRLGDGRQRCVGRHADVLVLVVSEQVAVLQVRVELDLVDGRADFGGLEDRVQVRLEEVADADALGFAGREHLFHLRPALLEELVVAFREEGRVDQV